MFSVSSTQDNKKNVLVYGYGGIGVIYSWLLEISNLVRVTAVARSNYDVVATHGTDINSRKFGTEKAWKPYRIVPNAAAAADRHYDFIICSFKCLPEANGTVEMIRPLLVDPQTGKRRAWDRENSPVIVLFQNGIWIEKPVQEAYPDLTILSAAIWSISNLKDGGRTLDHGDFEKIDIGVYEGDSIAEMKDQSKWPPERHQRGREDLNRFCEILSAGGGNPVQQDCIQASRVAKCLWNAGWGSMCSMTRQPLVALTRENSLPHTLPPVRGIMEEVIAVARSLGWGEDVLPNSSIDHAIGITVGPKAGAPQPWFKPSIQLDLENERSMELDPLIGNFVKVGKQNGVLTPRLDVAYAAFKVNQDLILASQQ